MVIAITCKNANININNIPTNQPSAYPQNTIPHAKTKLQGATVQIYIPSQPTICVSTGPPSPHKKTGLREPQRNPESIHTKISRSETPRKFFKGHPTKQNFWQTLSPGVVRGRATSLDGFVTPPRRKIPRIKGKKIKKAERNIQKYL